MFFNNCIHGTDPHGEKRIENFFAKKTTSGDLLLNEFSNDFKAYDRDIYFYEFSQILLPNMVGGSLNILTQATDKCRRCNLCLSRFRTATYRMTPRGVPVTKSKVVFIGQCPGDEEDLQGLPFVGQSGKQWEALVEESGFNYPSFMINVTACRPHGGGKGRRNENTKEEIIACSHRLWVLLQIIRPTIIVALGTVPASLFYLDPKKEQRFEIKEIISGFQYLGYIFHPSYLLRTASTGNGQPLDDTVKFLKKINNLAREVEYYPRDKEWRFYNLKKTTPFAFLEKEKLC